MRNNQKLAALLSELGGSLEKNNFEDNFSIDDRMKIAAAALGTNAAMAGNGMVKHIGNSLGSAGIEALIMQSVGDLNLTVTRGSANIAAPLPFIIFGANDFLASYASTLPQLIAATGVAGLTCVVSVDATGNVLFTYTAPAGVDVITVSNIGNINYRTFLASMQNNYFKTKYFGTTVSDATVASQQYAQPLLFGQLSSLGMTKANQLAFRSRQFSWTYLIQKVEVVLPEQTIAPEYSFAMNILAQAGFSIGFDFFMSERVNLNRV